MLIEITDFFKLIAAGVLLMLPIANPLTSMTLLITLGGHLPHEEKNRQITQATYYVVAILLITYYLGHGIFNALDISMSGVRIAGGLIVAFIGFTMLFPKPESATANIEQAGSQPLANIAFVPLALPGTAGPGSMALAISAASQMQQARADYATWVWWLAPVMVGVVLGLIFWVCLRSAPRIVSKFGPHGIDALSRVIGFLLICMGVQFCIDGATQLITH